MGMSGLSYETIGDVDYPLRALHRHRVEKAFRLKMEFSDEDCALISERMDRERGDNGEAEPGPDPVDALFM
jgi:hypothetical protein